MNFTFSKRARTMSMALMVLGLVLAAVGFFSVKSHDSMLR